jgi:hypothetical protein
MKTWTKQVVRKHGVIADAYDPIQGRIKDAQLQSLVQLEIKSFNAQSKSLVKCDLVSIDLVLL